jgi:prevent-host-death family protein
MKIASVADVKAKLSAYVKTSSKSPVIITRNGKAVAAIIPLADEDDIERFMLGYSPKLRAILSAARRRVRDGRGIPHQQFWRGAQANARAKSTRKST